MIPIKRSLPLIALSVFFIFITSALRWGYESMRRNGWDTVDFTETRIMDIAADGTGRVWVATDGKGLAMYDGSAWVYYDKGNSGIPSDHVSALDFDSQGRAWISVDHYAGNDKRSDIVIFDGTNWESFSHEPYFVNGLAVAPDDSIWVTECCSSLDGINIHDGQGWSRFTPANSGLIDDTVHVITFDPQGRGWLGTDDGVSLFDGENWTNYTPLRRVYGIAFDPDGNAWVGGITDRNVIALSVFQDGTWRTYSSENSILGDDMISSIAFDLQGRAWIGTYGGGTFVFDGVNWLNYNIQNSPLPNYWVSQILFDRDGSPWIAGVDDVTFARHPNPPPPLGRGLVLLYNWVFSLPATILLLFFLSMVWIAHLAKWWWQVLVGIVPGLIMLAFSGPPMLLTRIAWGDTYGFNPWMQVLLVGGLGALLGSAIGTNTRSVEHRKRLALILGIAFALAGSLFGSVISIFWFLSMN